ncbi:hypothetical protein [Actinacidiphila acididurans]|uniref:Uncharacterized protein n=1 Tax=Actinacidiphila acididurans TaxID=2784346 RepID=A0ABS2TTT9_9ACTN|nr:hypothetical protein [Actinacidiphila acididurans]MBM9506759.1 hypothetical protein [Actinacidiphila acididurans]
MSFNWFGPTGLGFTKREPSDNVQPGGHRSAVFAVLMVVHSFDVGLRCRVTDPQRRPGAIRPPLHAAAD